MEHLHDLLREKVRREHLNRMPADAAMSGKTTGPKVCWLCGREPKLRYRLKDTSSLCFSCFRTAYIAVVLPFINTPARRQSDATLLDRIERIAERKRASSLDASATLSNTLTDGFSIFEPSQASFVMSASRMRQRLQSDVMSPSSPTSPRRYWNCAKCTYVNPLSAKHCEACDFPNSSTVKCRHCGLLCPLDPEASKEQRQICANGKPHVMWYCGECGEVSTLDEDKCEHCHKARYWACSFCTAMHNVSRTKEGLRYCSTCGSYNTPQDVLKGQEKVDAEQKKASRIAAQQLQEARGAHGAGGADGGGNDADDVVFGVNDAQTLQEKQRQKDIEANTRRLNERLDALHIRRISQKSDGNCLFAALAHQLFGNQLLSFLVRSCVVAYMRENADDYRILFDGEKEWSTYISQMKESGNWGDELCINAASRCFCVNVHVITSDPTRWHMVFQHDELGRSDTNLRDKLPLPLDESQVRQSTSSVLGAHRAGGAASSSPSSSQTLSLFLAYLYPVHFDDVTPTDVPAVVLSDLIVPELHKMLTKEGGTAPARPLSTQGHQRSAPPPPQPSSTSIQRQRHQRESTDTARGTDSQPYDLGLDDATTPAATLNKHTSSKSTATTSSSSRPLPPASLDLHASLHSEQVQDRRGSAVSTSPTVERPAAPRARGPNSSPPLLSRIGYSSFHGQPPPPPPHPPQSMLPGSGGTYSNDYSFQ